MLSIENLAVGYRSKKQLIRRRINRDQTVLSDLNAHIPAGQFTCLLGINGIGKSTLLRTLAGVQTPLAGRVLVDSQDISQIQPMERARKLSVVFTNPERVGNLKVWDCVGLGRYPHTDWPGALRTHDREVIEWSLTATNCQHLSRRQLETLSDGERQRVMIARALAQQPQVLLLDEPTAYLDIRARAEMTNLLRSLAHNHGLAILASTHDLDLSLRNADQVWLLTPAGRLESGAPEALIHSGAIERAFS